MKREKKKKQLEFEIQKLKNEYMSEKLLTKRVITQQAELFSEIESIKLELEHEKRKSEKSPADFIEGDKKRQPINLFSSISNASKEKVQDSHFDLENMWDEREDEKDSLISTKELEAISKLSASQLREILQNSTKQVAQWGRERERLDDVISNNCLLRAEAERDRDRAVSMENRLKLLLQEYEGKDLQISSLRSQVNRAQRIEWSPPSMTGTGEGTKIKILEDQISRLSEANSALQSQNALLGKELDELDEDRTADDKVRDASISQLRQLLKEAREECCELRKSDLIRRGMSKDDQENLDAVKLFLFYQIAIYTKLSLADFRVFVNLNISDIYEDVKYTDYTSWEKLIHARYIKAPTIKRNTPTNNRSKSATTPLNIPVGSLPMSRSSHINRSYFVGIDVEKPLVSAVRKCTYDDTTPNVEMQGAVLLKKHSTSRV